MSYNNRFWSLMGIFFLILGITGFISKKGGIAGIILGLESIAIGCILYLEDKKIASEFDKINQKEEEKR